MNVSQHKKSDAYLVDLMGLPHFCKFLGFYVAEGLLTADEAAARLRQVVGQEQPEAPAGSYRTVYLYAGDEANTLNELAAEGWRLVAIIQRDGGDTMVYEPLAILERTDAD